MKKIAIIGAGSWGIALSTLLNDNNHKVTVWSILEDEILMLNKNREHIDKLPGVKLSEEIEFTTNLEDAIKDKDVLVFAVPSPYVRSTAKMCAPYVKKNQIIVNVAKGIEEATLMTMSDVIEDEIKSVNVCVLSGPTHAEEVGKKLPTTIVVGSKDKDSALYLQKIFMNDVFRVYISSDVIGIELGGSLKNVVALAAGITDGLGFGDNSKAALITRGLVEIARLGKVMGGKIETFAGLTGMGDLIVTCASVHSRNRKAGYLIGKGYTYEEAMDEVKMVVEGVYSAKAAVLLAKKYKVHLPIIEEVNAVLFGGKKPYEAVKDLMLRDGQVEHPLVDWK